jgi:hypothetical protein
MRKSCWNEQILKEILKISSVDTFELTDEEKNKLQEFEKKRIEIEENTKAKIKELQEKNKEDLKEIEKILSVIPNFKLPELKKQNIRLLFDDKNYGFSDSYLYFYDEKDFDKDTLDKLEELGKLDDFEYYQAKIERGMRPIDDSEKLIEQELVKILKEIFKTDKINRTEFKYNNRKYRIYLRHQEAVLSQIEKILQTIKGRSKVKSHYDVYSDVKFKELLNKYNLKDVTRSIEKVKGSFKLELNDGSFISLSNTGRLRFTKQEQYGQPILLYTQDHSESEDWTKEQYLPFLDKIDTFMQKRLKKQKSPVK